MSVPYPPPEGPPPAQPPPDKPTRRVTAKQISGGLLIALVLVFIVENTRKVDVRLIGPEVHAPLSIALLIAAVLGGLGTLLIQWRRHRKN
jgi:uncharacterized integral membrane protein